jgi:phenylalanyl-tRNA synthetase beta chain
MLATSPRCTSAHNSPSAFLRQTPPGGPAALTFVATGTPAWLEPGHSAVALLDGQPLAFFGELSASERESRKLRQSVYLAQLDLARLYDLPLRRITSHELSRFQAVERDFSFVLPDTVQWHTVASTVDALAINDLQSRRPVEIWRDPKKHPGVYSLLLRTVFQSYDRTLRDEDLSTWSQRIIDALTALGGTLRA